MDERIFKTPCDNRGIRHRHKTSSSAGLEGPVYNFVVN